MEYCESMEGDLSNVEDGIGVDLSEESTELAYEGSIDDGHSKQ